MKAFYSRGYGHSDMDPCAKRFADVEFRWIMMEVNEELSYFGVQIRWLEKMISWKLRQKYSILPTHSAPNSKDLFKEDATAERLCEVKRKLFCIETAKIFLSGVA